MRSAMLERLSLRPAWVRVPSALLDAVAQQLAWWATVLLVRTHASAAALLPTAVLVALSVTSRGRATALLSLVAAGYGFVLDTLLLHAHVLAFTGAPGASVTQPWMVGLWAGFGASFTASLAWLCASRASLAASLGAGAGVFAYRAGVSLGVLELVPSALGYLAIGAGWALAVSLLRALARWGSLTR
jgi:hypothetical protein